MSLKSAAQEVVDLWKSGDLSGGQRVQDALRSLNEQLEEPVHLTVRQKVCLKFCREYIERYGHSPTYDEIALRMSLRSKSGVQKYITALAEHGFISYVPRRRRSITIKED